jgi:hypothetical protein
MGFSNFEKVYQTPHEEHKEGKATFSDLKPGQYIFYYDKYKVHRLKVKSAQIENFVETYFDYKYEKQERVKTRFFIKTEEGVILNLDPDIARMYDSYQYDKPYFATFTASERYLESRIDFCQQKINNAQATVYKYEKLKEHYEKCKIENTIQLTMDAYKMSTWSV